MTREARRPHADIETEETREFNKELIAILNLVDGGYGVAADRAGIDVDKLPQKAKSQMPERDVALAVAEVALAGVDGAGRRIEGLETRWYAADAAQRAELDRRTRRTRYRRWLIGTAVATVAVGAAAVGIAFAAPDPAPPSAQACFPGLVDRGCGPDGAAPAFAPALGLAPVLSEIAAENDRVYRSGEPSVSVAHIVALPRTPTHRLAVAAVRGELEGARDAQRRTNATGRPSLVPLLRLLVVDIGPDGERWRDVLPGVVRQKDLPNRLVATTGPSGHPPAAADLPRDLARQGVPPFASRRTSGLDPYGRAPAGPGGPLGVGTETALAGPGGGGVAVIRDRSPGDYYVHELGESAVAAAERSRRPPGPVPDFDGGSTDAPDRFDEVVKQVCTQRARTVYFAGRADDLLVFVQALADRDCEPTAPVTVLTGDDAVDAVSALRRDRELGRDGEAGARSALESRRVVLLFTPGTITPLVADDTATETAIAVDRVAGCVRRVVGERRTPPPAYGSGAVTAGGVTQCYLADGLPSGPVPLLAVDVDPDDVTTTSVSSGGTR